MASPIRQIVDECSAVPNSLRDCPPPSEVALANEAWEQYLRHNSSVVVSTFQGLFRSTVSIIYENLFWSEMHANYTEKH